MKKESKERQGAGSSGGEKEWSSEHERRKRNWSEQDRRWRKERRHPAEADLDATLEPGLARRLLA